MPGVSERGSGPSFTLQPDCQPASRLATLAPLSLSLFSPFALAFRATSSVAIFHRLHYAFCVPLQTLEERGARLAIATTIHSQILFTPLPSSIQRFISRPSISASLELLHSHFAPNQCPCFIFDLPLSI